MTSGPWREKKITVLCDSSW